MNYKQHKHVGDCIIVGKNVKLHSEARGRIIFCQKEKIEYTSRDFFNDLKRYNDSLADVDIDDFRYQVEDETLEAHVQRSFGDVNAWAGDHAKLFPPDGVARTFEDLNVSLQMVANTVNFDYVALALKNWDHFMPMCYKNWKRFHREALRLAAQYADNPEHQEAYVTGVDQDGASETVVFDIATNDMAQAIFLDAYACHFLEDCFASGHLRTPRLLFGADMDSLRSKTMHDEDNEHRLTGCNKKGETFKLIGEHEERHDFTRSDNLERDEHMKDLLGRAVAAVAASVQQVCDVALGERTVEPEDYREISDLIPRVEMFWKELDERRSRTHALEFRPMGAEKDHPKPIYKFHANFNETRGIFEDPILLKRTWAGSWRKVLLGDVDHFSPGDGISEWLPRTPDDRAAFPS